MWAPIHLLLSLLFLVWLAVAAILEVLKASRVGDTDVGLQRLLVVPHHWASASSSAAQSCYTTPCQHLRC
jgi:hypothetical protein